MINEIWQLTSKMDEHVNDIEEKFEKHRQQLAFQDHLLSDHSSRITAHAGRIFESETEITSHGHELKRLEHDKTDLKIFVEARKKFELADISHEFRIKKNYNHCIALDNYMDNYLPLVT